MIGKHLKSFRLSMDMTLDALQEKCEVPKGHLSRIENNKVAPTREMLLKILIHGFDLKPSDANQLIAKWETLSALERAPDRSEIINSIIAGDNSIIIKGNNNSIKK